MNPLESPQNFEVPASAEPVAPTPEDTSFGDVLRQFEAEHQSADGQEAALEGTVLSVNEDAIVIDVGRKMEGILKPNTPRSSLRHRPRYRAAG